MAAEPTLPAWAKWCPNPALDPWTVGIEEEVMLLEPDGSPAWRSEDVLQALPARLAEHADATLEQHCSWWQERTGAGVSTATMSRAITALDWTRKKSR